MSLSDEYEYIHELTLQFMNRAIHRLTRTLIIMQENIISKVSLLALISSFEYAIKRSM